MVMNTISFSDLTVLVQTLALDYFGWTVCTILLFLCACICFLYRANVSDGARITVTILMMILMVLLFSVISKREEFIDLGKYADETVASVPYWSVSTKGNYLLVYEKYDNKNIK